MSFRSQGHGSEFLHSQGTFHIHGFGTNSSTFSRPVQAINGQDLDSANPTTILTAVDGAKEALGDLITTISELYEEHVPAGSVRMRFNKPNDLVNLQRGDKVATITSLQGIRVTVEELSRKLERFKVRTVTVGGIVKEETSGQSACIQIDSPCSRWFIHSA